LLLQRQCRRCGLGLKMAQCSWQCRTSSEAAVAAAAATMQQQC
jgi:hypothetical protein